MSRNYPVKRKQVNLALHKSLQGYPQKLYNFFYTKKFLTVIGIIAYREEPERSMA